ncbi:MAG: HAD family phosphatase [Alphaproteobacteria bacterium]|nr:HAD family phosphatase [Alphaproteobacteria bacterium]
MTSLRTVVFDLGNVLIEWNPRYLYRKLFNGDDAAMEKFLAEVCTFAWHEPHDAGVDFAVNAAPLIEKHPAQADLIRAWGERFHEMIPGSMEEVVVLLGELKKRGVPLYALSNWSHEFFPPARKRFAFLDWFDGIVVSGEEKVAKPDPRLFQILMERYGVVPQEALFIDDTPANIRTAQGLGFRGHLYASPPALRKDLQSLGLL